VAGHPERIDINFHGRDSLITSLMKKKEELGKLRDLGYIGSGTSGKKASPIVPDWTHVNAVAYHAELDQILLSVHEYSELWVIDHGTTTAEAAGHTGGKRGKGGDLFYRWGNPRAYRAGTAADRQLFYHHEARWIPRGHPGEGHFLVFNNGARRPGGNYSSVDELVLPTDGSGGYVHKPGTPYGPDRPVWSYTAPTRTDFFARIMSGAQRLPNGNTLICSGTEATVFEVTPAKEVVWKYVVPPQSRRFLQGALPKAGLQLNPDQVGVIKELQEEVSTRLGQTLTD
jgi:hypothetical protein